MVANTTLAIVNGSPTTTLTLATTPHTNGERPPWDDSFHTSANKGIGAASTSICPIAFPDTPMSNTTAHRSPSSPSNYINNNNNNDDELRDAFRNVKAFGQEIAHSWRERATRAENHCEHLEAKRKSDKEKLVDEQLKNAKFLDEQKITKATISRLETENATKESGQCLREKECERLSALLTEVNERNASIETVCKKHRDFRARRLKARLCRRKHPRRVKSERTRSLASERTQRTTLTDLRTRATGHVL